MIDSTFYNGIYTYLDSMQIIILISGIIAVQMYANSVTNSKLDLAFAIIGVLAVDYLPFLIV